jgi:predicted enzyme related to lactoylglutathione lyase
MAKKPNEIDFIEFPTENIAEVIKAKSFYSEVFNWTFKDWGENYADTTSSGIGSGFNADPEHRPSKPLVVIYVSDLQKARNKVIDSGGEITKDIFSFPGGKRFHFKDPAGNELAAWSDQ